MRCMSIDQISLHGLCLRVNMDIVSDSWFEDWEKFFKIILVQKLSLFLLKELVLFHLLSL